MPALTQQETRKLKALAQHLDPVVHVGKEGVTETLLAAVDAALTEHELIKVRFIACKDRKKELAPQIGEKTAAAFVTRVGNVAVYYRKSESSTRGHVLD